MCALCSRRAAPSSARAAFCRTGSTGRGAAGLAPVAISDPEESDPCRSPRTCSLHPNIPFSRCFFFSGDVCPVSRFPPPWVPRCLNILASVEPQPWYHRVPINSLGSLRNKSAAADSQERDSRLCVEWNLEETFVEPRERGVCRLAAAGQARTAGFGVRCFVPSPWGWVSSSFGGGECSRGSGWQGGSEGGGPIRTWKASPPQPLV